MRDAGSQPVSYTDYMPFVDGLRAIAVLSVVLAHAHIPYFSGGYAGVDIFFVISGFLIIGQIRSEVNDGRFSIFRFYARRTLRILPVFFLVLAVTVLAAPFILFIPDAYESFAKSAVAAPLMVTNILFYVEQGYFDTAAELKPLLHTWTLSVEEQFYLVVPMILVFLAWLAHRGLRHTQLVAGLFIGLISFMACVAMTDIEGRNAAFYLTPLRAWEFVAGGFVVPSLVARFERVPRVLLESVGLAGLVLIAATVLLLDEKSFWPGWLALLPVAGTVLIMIAALANPSILVARILSLRLPVLIGLVSYGWYLWHWPLLSYGRILRGGNDPVQDLVLSGGVGLILAIVTYVLIEKPVRNWRRAIDMAMRSRAIFLKGLASVFMMATVGGGVTFAGMLANDANIRSRYATQGAGIADTGCRIRTADRLPEKCLEGDYVLILGDSHADALYPALAYRFLPLGLNTISLARGGCRLDWFTPSFRSVRRDHRCANLIPLLETILKSDHPPKAVIMTALFANGVVPEERAFSEFLQELTSRRSKVLLLGPVPRFDRPALECVYSAERSGRNSKECGIGREKVDDAYSEVILTLGKMATQNDLVRFLDVLPVYCDSEWCQPDDDGVLLFRDRDHLYPSGVHRLVDQYPKPFNWLVRQDS